MFLGEQPDTQKDKCDKEYTMYGTGNFDQLGFMKEVFGGHGHEEQNEVTVAFYLSNSDKVAYIFVHLTNSVGS